MCTDMKITFSCIRLRIILFFVAVCAVPTESRFGEVTVLSISPNSSYVARGEPLLLNVTLNNTEDYRYVRIRWYFRRFFSISYQPVLRIHFYGPHHFHYSNYGDARFSAATVDQASLLLVNTTLNDSGTYRCNVRGIFTYSMSGLYFNVTIEDEPKAKITCSQEVTLTEKDDFSCLCKAIGTSHLIPTAVWVKNGKRLGDSTEHQQKLSLLNVSKDEAGTYICRAQLHSLMDEISTEITVNYSPRITSFQIRTIEDKSTKLVCVADGLPKPSYAITDSNGREISGVLNGVVVVGKNSSTFNATYTCIAKNNFGQHERKLNINNCHNDNYPSLLGQQSPESLSKGIEWYIVFISLIVGIIFGFGLLYGSQWIRRRRANAPNQSAKQNASSVIYAEPNTMPSSKQHTYSMPDAVPSQSPGDYQELDVIRANEEHPYQPLRFTTRMKKTDQSTGQR